jgi:hypothetical protein
MEYQMDEHIVEIGTAPLAALDLELKRNLIGK